VIGSIGLVIVALLVVGGGYAYLRFRYSQIKSVSIGSLTHGDTSQPFNVLLVGSDSRAGLTGPNAVQSFGSASQVAGQRSDVTSIMHIDPVGHRAAILSIPRDLFVPIAGTNGSNRINTAFDSGPDRLIQTIQTELGIPIQHYVEVNFDGFQNAVNALGGVDLNFPYPARDAYSGLHITQTGCQLLQGDQALAVARARHYQYYENGYWHTDPTSDLGRIRRQHTFLRAVAKRALSRGLTNPFTANAFIGAVVHNFTIDDQLGVLDLVGLARDFHGFNPNNLATYTLPTRPVNNYLGYGDVLFPEQPQDSQVIAQFLSNGPPGPASSGPGAISPSEVSVKVLNGVGTYQLAHRAAAVVAAEGFNVVATGDAPTLGYTEATVLYAPGKLAKAQELQGRVVGGALIREDPTLTGADVTLVVGSQWQGLKGAPATSSGVTSTTTPAVAPESPNSVPPYDPKTC